MDKPIVKPHLDIHFDIERGNMPFDSFSLQKEQEIKNIAIAEIYNPTFEDTKQFLAEHKIIMKENMPFVEDIILQGEKDTKDAYAEVYFPIQGKSYYFIVYINIEPQISVRRVDTSPGNRVYFSATSTEHSLDELLNQAGIEPTRTWKKGDRRGKGTELAIPRHNGFSVQPYPKETGEVEDKLLTLIKLLLPYKTNLEALSKIAYTGINIVYRGYQDHMGGIYFNTETIQGLATLNLSVDVDLYASGPHPED